MTTHLQTLLARLDGGDISGDTAANNDEIVFLCSPKGGALVICGRLLMLLVVERRCVRTCLAGIAPSPARDGRDNCRETGERLADRWTTTMPAR